MLTYTCTSTKPDHRHHVGVAHSLMARNETPRGKQRSIFLHAKIYFVASHGEFRKRLNIRI